MNSRVILKIADIEISLKLRKGNYLRTKNQFLFKWIFRFVSFRFFVDFYQFLYSILVGFSFLNFASSAFLRSLIIRSCTWMEFLDSNTQQQTMLNTVDLYQGKKYAEHMPKDRCSQHLSYFYQIFGRIERRC